MCLVLPFGQTTMPTYFFQGVHFVSLFFVITYCELLYYLLSWCPFWPFFQPAISRGLDVNSLFPQLKSRTGCTFVHGCLCVCVCGVRMVGSGSTPYTLSTYTARVHTANCIDEWGGLDLFFICLHRWETFTYNLKTQATVLKWVHYISDTNSTGFIGIVLPSCDGRLRALCYNVGQ